MGSHFTPRKVLSGFSDPQNHKMIWQYDKKHDEFAYASISKVAQKSGFYTPEVEAALRDNIEKPAHRVINKLLNHQQIAPEEQLSLAIYINVMFTRGPCHRQRFFVQAPELMTETVGEVKKEIAALGKARDIDPELVKRRIADVEAVEEKYKNNPPPEVLKQIVTPSYSDGVVSAILAMTWRFVVTDGPSFFMTSDNPVFFFTQHGVANPESEVTFPLSSSLALSASWQPGRDGQFLKCKQAVVKEFNRRIASDANRFLFYHRNEEWVRLIGRKTESRLNRILWEVHD